MEVLFYSLFDIVHEKDQSSPLFFHMKSDSDQQLNDDIKDVVKFADSTIQEADQLTKVRNYYFDSETTEIVSQIKDILNIHIEQDEFIETDMASKLQIISERYSRVEKGVIKKTNLNTPSPSNLFYVLGQNPSDDESNNYIFFIAKIEKSEFLHSEKDIFKLVKGLPHKTDGKKSDKNWKTATIRISSQVDESEILTLEIDEVVLSDTSTKVASYWADEFLEATEVTDDEKNTLQAYNEIRRRINNLNREKDKTPGRKADINHFINQLNGYFLNNPAFSFDDMTNNVFGFGTYKPVCSTLDMKVFQIKIDELKDSPKFDNNFSIIQSVVENKAKETFKVSDKIDIRINKHIENLREVITSEKDELGNPFIKIKVDSTENEAYKKFFYKSSSEVESD